MYNSKTAPRPVRRSPYQLLWHWALALLSLVGIIGGLSQLVAARLPLRVEQLRLGTIPVTIFTPAQGPPGPAVVIAHGFAASQQIMAPFAVTLARAGYTAVTFDFPGHGRNEAPLRGDLADSEGRYEQLRADLDEVVALARERSSGPVGLLGHSMGSAAVVRYAQQNPAIPAVVAVSLVYEGVTATSPANLLVINGALEGGLRPAAIAAVQTATDATPEPGVTYGDSAAGTARRVAFAPGVEHIGVLFSATSMAEALTWFQATMPPTQPQQAPSYLDSRVLWLGVVFLSATLLFWPLSLLMADLRPPGAEAPARRAGFRWRWWWAAAIAPALVAPVALRFIPAEGLLPILVGGPLALFFAIYGLVCGLGTLLVIRQWRRAGSSVAKEQPPVAGMKRSGAGVRLPVIIAAALLMIGYVFLTFGLPVQWFVLNYFPPPVRFGVVGAVCVAMLPYFLADEYFTRGPWAPPAAYLFTKILLIAALALAIALNTRLFFLVLIAPLFLAYFLVYGLFSTITHRRTGTPLVGALANTVIFAWIVAATFPLVG